MHLQLSDADYNIEVQGGGDLAFVFLHYFGGSSRTWGEALALLLGGVQLIAPDLRGFGASTSAEPRYTVNDYVDDVAAILETLGVRRYVLVGHSMGGKVALALAMRQPAGLEALALLAPSPPTPEPMSDEDRANLLSGYGNRAFLAEIVDRLTAHPLSGELRQLAIEDNLRSSRAAWDAWLLHGSREDLSAGMARITAPTYVLSGAADTTIPTQVIEQQVVRRIRGARLEIVPDAGHLLPLEAPGAVAAWLSRVKAEIEWRAGEGAQRPSYPPGTVRALLKTDYVTPKTREVLQARLVSEGGEYKPRFFDANALETLRVVASRLIPQGHRSIPVELASAIDARLADNKGDGWRYNVLPPDGEAYKRGLRALDESAEERFGRPFAALSGEEQDELLLWVQKGAGGGGAWKGLPAARFFEELLVELTACYYSDPISQEEIGYVGMADATGWQAIGLDVREPREPQMLETASAKDE